MIRWRNIAGEPPSDLAGRKQVAAAHARGACIQAWAATAAVPVTACGSARLTTVAQRSTSSHGTQETIAHGSPRHRGARGGGGGGGAAEAVTAFEGVRQTAWPSPPDLPRATPSNILVGLSTARGAEEPWSAARFHEQQDPFGRDGDGTTPARGSSMWEISHITVATSAEMHVPSGRADRCSRASVNAGRAARRRAADETSAAGRRRSSPRFST